MELLIGKMESSRSYQTRGICCFNVDTATTLAFVNSLVKAVHEQNEISFDIRKLLGDAREAVKNIVKEKISYFGSEGKVEISGQDRMCCEIKFKKL
jgi:fructose-bisphosphate aldolase class II